MAAAPRIRLAAPGRSRVIGALSTLLVYQRVGEVTVQAFGVPLPGPVLGVVLLFATSAVARAGGLEAASGRAKAMMSL